jgi:hypothetical protein
VVGVVVAGAVVAVVAVVVLDGVVVAVVFPDDGVVVIGAVVADDAASVVAVPEPVARVGIEVLPPPPLPAPNGLGPGPEVAPPVSGAAGVVVAGRTGVVPGLTVADGTVGLAVETCEAEPPHAPSSIAAAAAVPMAIRPECVTSMVSAAVASI